MPPSEITATSVVPPPISTIIEPEGSVTGRPAPIAAAIGSSIRNTLRAPALSALSWIARRSTAVEPDGTQTMISGEANPVSYTHLRAHETDSYLVCRLLLEKKK